MTRLAPGYGEHRFGETIVTLSKDGAEVVLPDGGEVFAHPARSGASLLLAVQLGYDGNTAAMMREWCYLHVQLCHVLGLPYSPALESLAHEKPETDLVRVESQMVVAAQRFLNLWRNGARE